jgi:hypothetical protein
VTDFVKIASLPPFVPSSSYLHLWLSEYWLLAWGNQVSPEAVNELRLILAMTDWVANGSRLDA